MSQDTELHTACQRSKNRLANGKLTEAGMTAAAPIPAKALSIAREATEGAKPHAIEKIAIQADPIRKPRFRP